MKKVWIVVNTARGQTKIEETGRFNTGTSMQLPVLARSWEQGLIIMNTTQQGKIRVIITWNIGDCKSRLATE